MGRTHAALDVDRLQVLPVLLEQGHEEVEGDGNVLADFFLLHLHVADRAAQAQDFLELELDGGLNFDDLLGEVVGEGNCSGELAGTVHVRTDDPRNGLDDGFRGKEAVVLGAELLHKLLVLVELLQVIHVLGSQTSLLGGFFLLKIANDADGETGASDVGQLNASGETLVTVDVVVLQIDLKINRLNELTLLLCRAIQDGLDGIGDHLRGDLGHS